MLLVPYSVSFSLPSPSTKWSLEGGLRSAVSFPSGIWSLSHLCSEIDCKPQNTKFCWQILVLLRVQVSISLRNIMIIILWESRRRQQQSVGRGESKKFRRKFQREIPLCSIYPNFFITQYRTGHGKRACQNKLDAFSRFHTIPACDEWSQHKDVYCLQYVYTWIRKHR